jgi:pimeloyl-ACP methyl ester carboxylesterase
LTESKRIVVRDIEFKVQIRGEGRPLVFLHGYGGHMKDWEELISHLPSGKVHLVFLKSLTSSLVPLRFSEQVGYLKELFENLFPQGEAIDLISTSYGSALAWALTQCGPLPVKRQVLINPMPLDPLMWIKSLELKMLAGIARSDLLLSLFLRTSRGQKHLRALGAIFGLNSTAEKDTAKMGRRKRILIFSALRRFFWLVRNEDWDAWANRAERQTKALIIYGAEDPLFQPEDFKQYEKLFTETQNYPVCRGSHLLMQSHPRLLASVIEAYLEASVPAASSEPAETEAVAEIEWGIKKAA